MQPKFNKGDKVIIKAYENRIGIIDDEPKELKGKLFYPVSLDPSQVSSYYPEDSLDNFVPPKSVEQLLEAKDFSTIEDFIQSLIYKKLEKPLSDNLYTFYSSRTEFQVHQFKPVIKFLNTFKQRLLLADEVGLGKTIEAGIIITEMASRLGDLSRVLIVCPSMLNQKWKREMQKRFGLDFNILKREDFKEFLNKYKEYGEAEKLKGIISLQTLRASQMIELLREISPHFDIVVVDEAHYMRNPETFSSELGDILSELSDALLFLSATPLQLGTPDLFNLLRLLIPEDFSDFSFFHNLIEPNEHINYALRRLYDPVAACEILKKVEKTSQRERFISNSFYQEAIDLLSSNNRLTHEQAIRLQKLLVELNCLSFVFTRTKKRDVDIQFPIREARVISVNFEPEEMDFYNAVTDFVSERFTVKYGSLKGISFAVIMPQRQVSSCIQAMKDSFDKIIRNKLIKSPSGDSGDIIDLSSDIDKPWKLEAKELSVISRLKLISNKIGNIDTKFDKFLEALRNLDNEDPSAKIMVFAFFKSTLNHLKKKLEQTEFRGKVDLIHGDISTKERERIIRKFRQSNDIKILLCSEVGSEGLDFEFCNVIFNYDLPWNPMRVEQRIGRLDRYGQKHEKIMIYNFSMKGTIDDEILSRLYKRINVFERYIGDLDAILGEQITELTKHIFNMNLTQEQKIHKIDKIAENIARRQQELEEFEGECQKFIGQDEYFNQEITKILETKRFITSDEVLFFLKCFLNKCFSNTTLLQPKSGRENVYVLKCDDEFRTFLRQYSSASDNIKELERKLSFDGGTLVTFKSQEACKDDFLELITIHHPIIKGIKRYYDNNKQHIRPVGNFRLKGRTKYQGIYLFYIYMVEKTALKKDLILLPILVNLKNSNVHILEEVCDWFLGEIVKAEIIDKEDIATYDSEYLKVAAKISGEFLNIFLEEEEQDLKRLNDTLVNNQIESVKQAAKIKIDKTNDIIERFKVQGKNIDDPIIRLHKGRIRNIEHNRDNKIESLEKKRAVSVGFNLIISSFAPLKWGEAVESIGDRIEISLKLGSWITKLGQSV
jgi:SNF2 family DNA or RNA helicase